MSKCSNVKQTFDELIHLYEKRICQINKNTKKKLRTLPDVEYEKFHGVVRSIEKNELKIRMFKEFIFNIRALKGDIHRIDELVNFYGKNCNVVREYSRSKESELQKMLALHSNTYYVVKQESPEELAKCIEDCLLKEQLIGDFIDRIAEYRIGGKYV